MEKAARRSRQMRALILTSPGPLPTVVHDLGPWWPVLVDEGGYEVARHSLNADYWRDVLASVPTLDAFTRADTYRSAHAYASAVGDLSRQVSEFNASQSEFVLDPLTGPICPRAGLLLVREPRLFGGAAVAAQASDRRDRRPRPP